MTEVEVVPQENVDCPEARSLRLRQCVEKIALCVLRAKGIPAPGHQVYNGLNGTPSNPYRADGSFDDPYQVSDTAVLVADLAAVDLYEPNEHFTGVKLSPTTARELEVSFTDAYIRNHHDFPTALRVSGLTEAQLLKLIAESALRQSKEYLAKEQLKLTQRVESAVSLAFKAVNPNYKLRQRAVYTKPEVKEAA